MPIRKTYEFERVAGAKVGRLNQGINTQFIVYRIDETVIDTGPSNQWRHVKQFLSSRPVEQLLLTHHHEDHSGNAHSISVTHGVLPKAPALAQEKLANGYKTPFLQKLVWGSLVPVETQTLKEQECLADGSRIISVHTPGHAKDLTCFFLPDQGYFFSGDLFIARKLKMLRSDENLQQLIESIQKVLKLDFKTLFCPHGGVIEDGKIALQQKLDNILETCEKAQSLHKEGMGLDDITHQILGPEDMVAKLTGGNFCKMNLVRQGIELKLS